MTEACWCGCGETPAPGKRYVRGHWSRTPAAKAMYTARRVQEDGPNPSGLCQCGCGQPAPVADRSDTKRGRVKGQPLRFIHGHHMRGKRGPETSGWRGGRWTQKDGYVYLFLPEHPQATRDGYVFEHRVVAEQKLGRYLLPAERVHHVNGIKDDNRPENVVVLTTNAEHLATHHREDQRAAASAWNRAHLERVRAAGKKGAAARWGKPVG